MTLEAHEERRVDDYCRLRECGHPALFADPEAENAPAPKAPGNPDGLRRTRLEELKLRVQPGKEAAPCERNDGYDSLCCVEGSENPNLILKTARTAGLGSDSGRIRQFDDTAHFYTLSPALENIRE